MKKINLLLFAFFVVVLISGCNFPLIGSPTSTPTLTPTLTPAPSATPVPSPTPTPTLPPVARIDQADRSLATGEYEQAQQDFQGALTTTEDDQVKAAAFLGLGRVAFLNGDCPSAVTSLNQVVRLAPDGAAAANASYFLARCLTDQQSSRQAAEAYQNYVRLRPGIIDDYMEEQTGDALAAAGDYPSAIQAYEKALKASGTGDHVWLEIKIARAYSSQNDYTNSIRLYLDLYTRTSDDFAKAQIDWLVAQDYIAFGMPEQADARYQDAVNNFPRSYDSYSALLALVNADQPVDELNRGLVDYFAGQYGVAVDAFERYLNSTPDHDGTAHHYKALSLRALGQYDAAIAEWDALIKDHTADRFWITAWEEKADTYYNPYTSSNLDKPQLAINTLLGLVALSPTADAAPDFLFLAARYQEINDKLPEAAATWLRMINEYPSAEQSYRGLFLAGITYYRLSKFDEAQTQFQRALALATSPADEAAAGLWVGKTQLARGDSAAAKISWQQASLRDPTGYYSERAKELLENRPPFATSDQFNLSYDLAAERVVAEEWLRQQFNLPADINFNDLTSLQNDARFRRGNAFYELGLYPQARAEYESLRKDLTTDALSTYRLMNHLLDQGFTQSAILSARQVLTLANMDDATSLTAPIFFSHVRFGAYFRELVLPAAQEEDLPPLYLFSVMRQESRFESAVTSSAGARGLMQIMPATGAEIASNLGWPPNYSENDLYRPSVSIRLGAHYLARQRDYLDGDLMAALAGYNGGPGFARTWKDLSNNDPDLFLEVIRASETRSYVMLIMENLQIYRGIYETLP